MSRTEGQDWFITANGLQVWASEPDPALVRTSDISEALARLCRFGGHLAAHIEHYSVAQHCVLVCELSPKHLAGPALMHDATEAYLGDVIRPVKLRLSEYLALEEKWQSAIDARFGFSLSMQDHEAIAKADRMALLLERRDLLHRGAVERLWPSLAGFDTTELPNKTIVPMNFAQARDAFERQARRFGVWLI